MRSERFAMIVERATSQDQQKSRKRLIKPPFERKQDRQRHQRRDRMGEIGGPVWSTYDEFGGAHAEKGEHKIRFGGERARIEPEDRTQSPDGASYDRENRVTPGPDLGGTTRCAPLE